MSLTLNDLASLVGCPSPPEADAAHFTGVASLEQAGPGEISFLGNPRYLPQLKTTRAGAVIVPEDTSAARDDVRFLPSETPSRAFTRVVEHFQKEQLAFSPGIHPAAHVDPDAILDAGKVRVKAGAVIEAGATIGNGSDIGAGVHIARGVRLGRDCLLHANATVREGCQLGDRVILQPGAVIGSDGFGYETVDGKHHKIPQVGIVLLGDDVEIGANSCIDRARFGETRLGKGTKIDNLVQIGHNATIGEHCLVISQTGIAGSAKLGDRVTVAAQSGVAGHLTVGDDIVLAARSGVTKELSKPGIYSGFPTRPLAREQRRLASIGLIPKILQRLKKLESESPKSS